MSAIRPVSSSRSIEFPSLASSALPQAELAALALRWGRDRERWRTLVRHDSRRRWYAPLYADALCEVWLLGWAPGQEIELHDHGRAAGALFVAEGFLLERRPDGSSRGLRDALLSPGRVSSFGVGEVHGLCNVGIGNATSIHVYSPRLSQMTFFDHVAPGRLAAVRDESFPALQPESIP